MRHVALRSCRLWSLVLLATVAAGCGSSDGSKKVILGKLGGTVTLDGEPVRSGCVITFLPKSAGTEVASALIRENGVYAATSGNHAGVPIGEYAVIVLPPRLDPKEEEELEKKNTQAVMSALLKRDKRELEKVEYPQDAIVPRKYWTQSESGLNVTVVEGDNTANFELKRAARK